MKDYFRKNINASKFTISPINPNVKSIIFSSLSSSSFQTLTSSAGHESFEGSFKIHGLVPIVSSGFQRLF
uniref:Uncharacterized protein n=1 Tax=Pararge aegeria TaxID=116150 RepID=S4NUI3_9NEOP